MILVDTALAKRAASGCPIRVGIVGAGAMAGALVNQITNSVPGMRVVAMSNRAPQRAAKAFHDAGLPHVRIRDTQAKFDVDIEAQNHAATSDAMLLCRSPHVDVIVEATGSVEFGAQVAMEAFRNGKHVVLMNAEVDATIGPILAVHARRHGVLVSACDGDEPGVQMNLVRWVRGMGLTPRVVGNVKGLQDPYRTPTTQQAFAERWGQNPAMVTSFADGSKISFEQAIVANATGFTVLQRGMSRGRDYRGDVANIGDLYDLDRLRAVGGIVDYVVGTPSTKVFVLGEHDDPKQRHFLELYKVGKGPLYAFSLPHHLVHFEVPSAIARVVLFGDTLAPPLDGPVVEVCAVAKRDLKRGETLDGLGMYMTYGEAASVDEMSARRYLPQGLSEGCRLRRDIARDEVLTYDDVELPPGRVADDLRAEQYLAFRGEAWLRDRASTLATA